jgi:hypothetical protein
MNLYPLNEVLITAEWRATARRERLSAVPVRALRREADD